MADNPLSQRSAHSTGYPEQTKAHIGSHKLGYPIHGYVPQLEVVPHLHSHILFLYTKDLTLRIESRFCCIHLQT